MLVSFFVNETATTEIYTYGHTLSLHDALPILISLELRVGGRAVDAQRARRSPFQSARISRAARSEEHTSELQSLMRISYAVFCLKKKNKLPHLTFSENNN